MPLYRTLDLSSKSVKYVQATSKAQARSHVARRVIQVENADTEQMSADALEGISLAIEKAGDE